MFGSLCGQQIRAINATLSKCCCPFSYIYGLFQLSFTSIFPHINTYRTFYIVGYAISSILLGVMAFIRSYGLASFGVRSSFSLHGGVLRSVLRAPMAFFDTTPTGRILARFSKDMQTVDSEIADFLDIFVVRLRLLFWFVFV